MQKNGVGHVEVILSFVIFIVAVGFGLYFFNTEDSSRLAESSLTYAIREISQNTSVDLETFSVVIKNSEVPSGAQVLAIDFSGMSGKTGIEDYGGNELDSYNDGNYVNVKADSWVGVDFIFVRFCEEFNEEENIGSGVYNETYYKIGFSNTEEVISEKRFLELKDVYDADYIGLKGEDNFNLANRINFAFSLTFDSDEVIKAERPISQGLDVFSDSKRVKVLRTNGKIVFADLTAEVW